jgi:hypothetical protein
MNRRLSAGIYLIEIHLPFSHTGLLGDEMSGRKAGTYRDMARRGIGGKLLMFQR